MQVEKDESSVAKWTGSVTDSGEGQMVVDSKESKNLSFYDKGLFGVKMKQMNTSDLLKKKECLREMDVMVSYS